MRIVVPVLFLSISLLQACTKKTNESNPPFKLAHDGISCEVDGVRKEYYYKPEAILSYAGPLQTLMIAALKNDSLGQAEDMSMWFYAKNTSYVFTKGIYSADNANSTTTLSYSLPPGYYLAGSRVTSIYADFVPKQPLTITITRLDSARCEGTFSGQVFYMGDASSDTPSKNLTNGVFSVPAYYY